MSGSEPPKKPLKNSLNAPPPKGIRSQISQIHRTVSLGLGGFDGCGAFLQNLRRHLDSCKVDGVEHLSPFRNLVLGGDGQNERGIDGRGYGNLRNASLGRRNPYQMKNDP